MAFSSDQPLLSNQLSLSIDYPKPEEPDFLGTISLDRKRIVDAINTKEGALYLLQEIANFKQIFTPNKPFTNRNSYRFTYDVVQLNGGNIPAGASRSFPHGITSLRDAVLIYASCTSVTGLRFTVTYPYATLDIGNINFTNPLPADALSQVMFVAEYTKTS